MLLPERRLATRRTLVLLVVRRRRGKLGFVVAAARTWPLAGSLELCAGSLVVSEPCMRRAPALLFLKFEASSAELVRRLANPLDYLCDSLAALNLFALTARTAASKDTASDEKT